MSFGLHLVLAIVWALITLGVLALGIWAIVAALAPILYCTCFALVAISSLFIYSDVKMLFGNKNAAAPKV